MLPNSVVPCIRDPQFISLYMWPRDFNLVDYKVCKDQLNIIDVSELKRWLIEISRGLQRIPTVPATAWAYSFVIISSAPLV